MLNVSDGRTYIRTNLRTQRNIETCLTSVLDGKLKMRTSKQIRRTPCYLLTLRSAGLKNARSGVASVARPEKRAGKGWVMNKAINEHGISGLR